ncbi:MAG: hypothetical protein ACE3JP_15380 [Ectobacillus sp.]
MSENMQQANLEEWEIESMMKSVGEASVKVLKTGETVFLAYHNYDLLLMLAQDEFYIQSSLFPLSKCVTETNEIKELPMPPLFAGKRHFINVEDLEGYVNEEGVQQLDPKQKEAMFFLIHLTRSIQLVNS